MTLGLSGAFGLVGCAILLVYVTRIAANGNLDRNGLIGIRTRATRSSDAAWVAGHRAALRPANRVAAACLAFAVAMSVASIASGSAKPNSVVVTLYSVGYVVLIVGAVIIARIADRAARATASAKR